MARGGYRPGAGRPKLSEAEKAERLALKAAGAASPKNAAPKRKTAPAKPEAAAPEVDQPAPSPDLLIEAEMANATPLDYMLMVMRAGNADPARRDRMAIAAAPFMHPRKEPVGEGKREKAAIDAKDAVSRGKFSASPPPKLAAVGGKKL